MFIAVYACVQDVEVDYFVKRYGFLLYKYTFYFRYKDLALQKH